MLILALDTALDRTSVALADGGRIAVSQSVLMDRGHAERLLPMIDAVLAEAGVAAADIERIAVDVGPGSFTGIRIAVAAARGLALALGVPAVGIVSLSAIAASLSEPADGAVLSVVDARRGELYAGLCDRAGRALEPPFAADAATVWDRLGARTRVVAGSGSAILAHHLATTGQIRPPIDPVQAPDPLAIARLGATADPATAPARPFYLRAADAKPQLPVPGLLK